jgi:hypothetical protein
VKTIHRQILVTAGLACTLAGSTLTTQAFAQEANFNKLANLPFSEGRPTKDSAQTLNDELLFQRAVQVYLWAMPLINTLGMQVGSEKTFGAGYNVLPIWKQRLDAKTLVTTPNSDVLYAMSYVDLGKDGPLVYGLIATITRIVHNLRLAWIPRLFRCHAPLTAWRFR